MVILIIIAFGILIINVSTLLISKQKLENRLNRAYNERNYAAILAADLALKCGMKAGYTIDKEWKRGWNHLVRIQLDEWTQVSWHMNPETEAMVKDLPETDIEWDGTFHSRTGAFLNYKKHLRR